MLGLFLPYGALCPEVTHGLLSLTLPPGTGPDIFQALNSFCLNKYSNFGRSGGPCTAMARPWYHHSSGELAVDL